MAKYSPDIAGIMSCLCNALTDDAHGIADCVIESSDNDNHDGEIFIEIPDGQGGMDSHCIKIGSANCISHAPRKRTATLTVEITFDPQVTDAESIASAADRLLDTALSTPGILSEYGDPSFDAFRVTIDADP